MNNNNFTIISFYQFRQLKNLHILKKFFSDFGFFHKLKGTIIISPEGINGSISGLNESIRLFEKMLFSRGFKNLELKYSFFKYMPFNRFKIKIKKEIITFSKTKLDVQNNTASYINSKKWNNLIEKKDVLLIDVRNRFEHNIGTFKNAINPNTNNFSEFKKFIDNNLSLKKDKKIAMFCTGGIRCEKASSYMLNQGFINLYQLKGGILKYLEETSKSKSKWIGECFVFDNRVSVKNELKSGTYILCHGCREPLSKNDRKSDKYEEGICCLKCFNKISIKKRKSLKERNQQIQIAKKKGLYNPYIKFTTSNIL